MRKFGENANFLLLTVLIWRIFIATPDLITIY